jgi:hypothetical protein
MSKAEAIGTYLSSEDVNSVSLAKPLTYHQASKNCGYDLDIFLEPLWGG